MATDPVHQGMTTDSQALPYNSLELIAAFTGEQQDSLDPGWLGYLLRLRRCMDERSTVSDHE
jgi:hypothetical protein